MLCYKAFIFYQSIREKPEEYGNNGIFGVDRKQMRMVDGKQEIYLEWPNSRTMFPCTKAYPETRRHRGKTAHPAMILKTLRIGLSQLCRHNFEHNR